MTQIKPRMCLVNSIEVVNSSTSRNGLAATLIIGKYEIVTGLLIVLVQGQLRPKGSSQESFNSCALFLFYKASIVLYYSGIHDTDVFDLSLENK